MFRFLHELLAEKKIQSMNNKNLLVENLFTGLKTHVNIKSIQRVFKMVRAALLKEDKLR